MRVQVRRDSHAPGFLSLLYEPGQAFEFDLGEGVPLPSWLEPAPPLPEKQELKAGPTSAPATPSKKGRK